MTGIPRRTAAALQSRPFRRLLATRLASQFGDGAFQAYLVAQIVFLDPERQGTALGVAKAFALLLVPFSLIGPVAGVLIDRWPRRHILTLVPLLRAAALAGLLSAGGEGPSLYGLSLFIVSTYRLYLTTLTTVTPLLVG